MLFPSTYVMQRTLASQTTSHLIFLVVRIKAPTLFEI
jgi:hypothetical protein